MNNCTLIPLPSFWLPTDLPWRVGFVSAVDDHLRGLRCTGHFRPPRFFGYYIRGGIVTGIAGDWSVRLDQGTLLSFHFEELGKLTHSQFSFVSQSDTDPDYMLIHDRRDGACWLWSFKSGRNFIEASEPVTNQEHEESDIPRQEE